LGVAVAAAHEHPVGIRACLAVQDHPGGGRVAHLQRIVSRTACQTQDRDARVRHGGRAVKQHVIHADVQRIRPDGAQERQLGVPVPRHDGAGKTGVQADLDPVRAAIAVDGHRPVPVPDPDLVRCRPARQAHVVDPHQFQHLAGAGAQAGPVQQPVRVGRHDQLARTAAAVVPEVAADLVVARSRRQVVALFRVAEVARLPPLTHRGRLQVGRIDGQGIFPAARLDRQPLQSISGHAGGADHDRVVLRAGLDRHLGNVEEIQLGEPGAAQRAAHLVGLCPLDQGFHSLGPDHGDRIRDVSEEHIVGAVGVAGRSVPQAPRPLRGAQHRASAADGHGIAHVVARVGVGAGQRGSTGRLQPPLAVLQAIRKRLASPRLIRNVPAIGADDQFPAVQGHGEPEVISGGAPAQGQCLLPRPARAGAMESVRSALVVRCPGRPDDDPVAAHVDRLAEIVASLTARGGERGA